jgi:hypothetical protein
VLHEHLAHLGEPIEYVDVIVVEHDTPPSNSRS